MARWQRDPRGRQRVAQLLAAVEVLALVAVFWPIFGAYFRQVNFRLSSAPGESFLSSKAAVYVAVAATVVWLAAAALVGLKYVQGLRWPRLVFLGANVLLLGLGLVWFLHNRLGGTRPDQAAALWGLVLPLVTLFPLLWPLLTFRAKVEMP